MIYLIINFKNGKNKIHFQCNTYNTIIFNNQLFYQKYFRKLESLKGCRITLKLNSNIRTGKTKTTKNAVIWKWIINWKQSYIDKKRRIISQIGLWIGRKTVRCCCTVQSFAKRINRKMQSLFTSWKSIFTNCI